MAAETKKSLDAELKRLGILKSNTEQIVINCNAGNVCDWKELLRHK